MAKWHFSVDVDVKHCSRTELEELVQKKELRGSEALAYRAGVITHFLSRLEQTRHKRHLKKGLRVTRRNEWAIVTRVPARSKVKLGSVVSAIDGISTLRSTFETTRKLLTSCSRVTFRRAPFYQGWIEIRGSGVCYFVVGYGWVSYFDQSKAPRTRLGMLSLADALLTPSSSSAICLSSSDGKRIVLSQPPTHCDDKFKPIIPILDLAALLVVAVAHANGTDDVCASMRRCHLPSSTLSCNQHQHASIQATEHPSRQQHKDNQIQHDEDLSRGTKAVEKKVAPLDSRPPLLTVNVRQHSTSSEDIEPPVHVLNRSEIIASGESLSYEVPKSQRIPGETYSHSARKPGKHHAFLFLDGARHERGEKTPVSVLDSLAALFCCSTYTTGSENSSAPENYYYY